MKRIAVKAERSEPQGSLDSNSDEPKITPNQGADRLNLNEVEKTSSYPTQKGCNIKAEHLSDRVCIIDAGSVKTIDTPKNLMDLHQKGRLEEVFLKLMQESDYVEK